MIFSISILITLLSILHHNVCEPVPCKKCITYFYTCYTADSKELFKDLFNNCSQKRKSCIETCFKPKKMIRSIRSVQLVQQNSKNNRTNSYLKTCRSVCKVPFDTCFSGQRNIHEIRACVSTNYKACAIKCIDKHTRQLKRLEEKVKKIPRKVEEGLKEV